MIFDFIDITAKNKKFPLINQLVKWVENKQKSRKLDYIDLNKPAHILINSKRH